MIDFPSEDGPMYRWPKVEAVEGASRLLHELSRVASCHVATNAVTSSETDIRKALARVQIDEYITSIFCFQNIGFKKPSKAFFSNILAVLKAEKNEIVMVGDNLEKDVYGALDFGLDAIWFNTGKRKTPKGIISVECLLQIINS